MEAVFVYTDICLLSATCWRVQCGGPYFGTVTDKKGKKSQYHTDGWYNCNNVNQRELETQRDNEAAKLQRWERISDQ